MKNDCVFCAIAAGEIPSFKIFEDGEFLAYLDINPFSKGHALVIPKEHYPCLAETPDDVLARQIATVKKVATRICSALGADGYNVLQNNGEAAGQTVRHIHFHVIPRYEGGGVSFEGAKADMAELSALADAINGK
jgi:histidine triad (HIT) family protein